VADKELLVATAIKDVVQEGAIAASLTRLGWKVIYRATSPEVLLEKLQQFNGATLLLSDDFIADEKIQFENKILIRGASHPLGRAGIAPPTNDFELGELLRNRASERAPEKLCIAATQSKVIALTALQGGVGTTTLALNFAEQISLLGKQVLLVDANRMAPAIAELSGIHDIRTMARELTPNLSLFEISELDQLLHLSEIAAEFDFIVMDLGALDGANCTGARASDRTLQWVLHSQGKIILTTGSFRKSIDRAERGVNRLRDVAPALKIALAITLESAMSRRDRAKIEGDISERFSVQALTFTRDHGSISTARNHGSTLQMSAPRSSLNREITQFVREVLAQE
jgi:cellulose biosynthesis protein BcsQ